MHGTRRNINNWGRIGILTQLNSFVVLQTKSGFMRLTNTWRNYKNQSNFLTIKFTIKILFCVYFYDVARFRPNDFLVCTKTVFIIQLFHNFAFRFNVEKHLKYLINNWKKSVILEYVFNNLTSQSWKYYEVMKEFQKTPPLAYKCFLWYVWLKRNKHWTINSNIRKLPFILTTLLFAAT